MDRFIVIGVFGFLTGWVVHGEDARAQENRQPTQPSAPDERVDQLFRESWELFKGGLYVLALAKKEEEFEAICTTYAIGSWRRSIGVAELGDFRRAAALGSGDRKKLGDAMAGYSQQILLLRQDRAAEAATVGAKPLDVFIELLGEDSALVVRHMGNLIRAYERTGDLKQVEELVARKLKICERTRSAGDPEWISAKLIAAEMDLATADRFWKVGSVLKACVAECPTDPKYSMERATALHLLSRYYHDLGDTSAALKYSEEHMTAIAGAKGLSEWQTIQGRMHHVRCLVYAGKSERASEECTRLDEVMATFERDMRSNRARWQIVRAEVMLGLRKYQDAAESLEKAREYSPERKIGLAHAQMLLMEGELALQKGDSRKGEQALESGIAQIVKIRKGDHACLLVPLKRLSETKRKLHKEEEAPDLEHRATQLAARIAEARK